MKTGDKVQIVTTAGSRRVDKDGQLVGCSYSLNKLATIISLDCLLPTYGCEGRPINNAIVQLCDTKGIIFIHTNCLKPVDKKIEVRYFCDGQDVTDSISDTTKRNLKCIQR